MSLLGAFLLFQVQPILSKYILPWYGGGAGVWTVCLLFFQSALIAGYTWASLFPLGIVSQAAVSANLVLLGLAILSLPVIPPPSFRPAAGQAPTAAILWTLFRTVGLPFVALAATSPLLQSCFARLWPARSPYRLYALSNAGSLLALISYPFVVEPWLPLRRQAIVWSSLFVAYSLGMAAVLIGTRRYAKVVVVSASTGTTASLALWAIAGWFAWPMLSTAVLATVTVQLCENVASAPLLWILPLSLYLLTFIIAFERDAWYRRDVTTILCLAGIAGIAWFHETRGKVPLLHHAIMYGTFLTAACLICHGELARLRPASVLLTRYYVAIAIGGATGTLLVSIVSPLLFNDYHEWTIVLIACWAASAMLLALAPAISGSLLRRLVMGGAFSFALAGAWYIFEWTTNDHPNVIRQTRNFYGVLQVTERKPGGSDLPFRTLNHGAIIHGGQFHGATHRKVPVGYYTPRSGIGRTLLYYGKRPQARMGMVGLGAGTVAAYGTTGQEYRFFEINRAVADIARREFTYLAESGATTVIALGDARLSLEREATDSFDVLAIDAFSGDAIPTHLLTIDAMALYDRVLKPDGALAFHISNSYLDLTPVVYAAGEWARFGIVRLMNPSGDDQASLQSEWIVLSRNPDFLRAMLPYAYEEPKRRILWTDDYTNLLSVMRFGPAPTIDPIPGSP